VIADTLNVPGDKDQVDVAAHLLRILDRACKQALGDVLVHRVERLIAFFQRPA
jgi:hypothetical protein